MKIIALLPVKNESWILDSSLKNLRGVADEIIAVDDNSTDNSREILRTYGALVLENNTQTKAGWAEHSIRENLIKLGRERGGTHFICLDADEMLSAPFLKNGREIMKQMRPGQVLSLEWITLWKTSDHYRRDGVYSNLYKDFIICDDGVSEYQYAFLGVARVPGSIQPEQRIKIDPSQGVVLHFQFVRWHMTQLKQAWYRCSEFINGKSPRKINAMYLHTLDTRIQTDQTPETWIAGIETPVIKEEASWHLKKIQDWFDQYGIEYFEPLQIWHVKELHDQFFKKKGREPKPKTFPLWLIKANELRHKLLS